ncbi:hypothetical protein CON39_11980 [Bacillus thuringiensis]|uniref:hypothetical protein n=1 Tax=Bacillus thuringiensis TaxID=1428 RepID=UPI000BEE39A4|nr:hypothetical protein [Bacillus thuringiensis]PEF30383.1 hypothetical protein CON39_11980 [Bacillus thuringiensis]
MDKKKQYDTLVEIVANARMLLAQDDDTNDYAEKIRVDTKSLAGSLGYSEEKFNQDTIMRYMELNKSTKEAIEMEGRTHKMEVLVDITPMANGSKMYTANVDVAGERDFGLEGKNMRSIMLATRAEAKARSINRSEIRIMGEFIKSYLTEDDKKVWETDIFEL